MKNSLFNRENNSVTKDAAYYFQEGNAFYFLGELHKAVASYTEAIKLNSACVNAYYNRGIVYSTIQRGTYSQCDDFKKVIELNPTDAEAYFNQGNRSLSVLGRRPEAYLETLEYYNHAINLNPNFADAYFNRYKILLTLNKPEEAIIDGKKAIELKTSTTFPYNNGVPLKDLPNLNKDPNQLIYDNNIRLKMEDNNEALISPLVKNQKTLDIYDQNIKDNYYNKGKLLNSIGYEEEAFVSFSKGLEINRSNINHEVVQARKALLKQLTSLHTITKEMQNILNNSDQANPEVKKLIYFLKEFRKAKISITEQAFENLEIQAKQDLFNKTHLTVLSKQITDIQLQAEEIRKQIDKFKIPQATQETEDNDLVLITEIKEILEKNIATHSASSGDKAVMQSQINNISSKLLNFKDKIEVQQTIEAMKQFINNKSNIITKGWLFGVDDYLDKQIALQGTVELNNKLNPNLAQEAVNNNDELGLAGSTNLEYSETPLNF
ncbi:tetratricopeptide repeat protein [Rickettsia endosymbiont of Ceutorhynchus obstrictus]|uniref:tetratricopeptide repeat protein n=1 Tax=Rickettsia endosymbiont of Ceutorhynchus obstrictus TaxID=3066249 RepID=UPI0031332B50